MVENKRMRAYFFDVDPVARMESFRALKLSRLDNFLTLKSKTLKENFRALKLSDLDSFRVRKSSIRVWGQSCAKLRYALAR